MCLKKFETILFFHCNFINTLEKILSILEYTFRNFSFFIDLFIHLFANSVEKTQFTNTRRRFFR